MKGTAILVEKEPLVMGKTSARVYHGHGGVQQALVLRTVCVHATETKARDLAGRSRSLSISDSHLETSIQMGNMCSLGREGREKQAGFEANETKYKAENSFIFFHPTHPCHISSNLQPCVLQWQPTGDSYDTPSPTPTSHSSLTMKIFCSFQYSMTVTTGFITHFRML